MKTLQSKKLSKLSGGGGLNVFESIKKNVMLTGFNGANISLSS